MNFTLDRNRVEFPNRAFTVNLLGAKFIYGFSPRAFFNAFIQYNADTHQLSSNIRFDLIHRPLSDIFLVYNERRSSVSGDLIDRAIIAKFTYMIVR